MSWEIPVVIAVVAIVTTQIVSRVRWALAEATHESVASVLQRNDHAERLAEASAQLHPVGARALTKTRSVATVRAYDEQTRTYTVEIEGDDGAASTSVTLEETDLEVPEIAEFVVYPIKSCAGTRLETAEITGAVERREWA